MKNVHRKSCRRHCSSHTRQGVILSVDGVAEAKSTSRSLEIISIQFLDCKQVYPVLISRPEPFRKKEMKSSFQTYLGDVLAQITEENLHLDKVVVDAPERAACRRQKLHGGFYSCNLCVANPDSVTLPGSRCSKLLPIYECMTLYVVSE